MWQADAVRTRDRHIVAACLALLLWVRPAAAQRIAAPSWLTLDTSADVDRAVDASGATTGAAIFDAYIAARVAPGLEIAARPWTQRQANGEWNRQLWI